MNGANLLVKTLGGAGVRRIFSLSGNQIMPVYDACIDSGIDIVHVRHEAAAVFMADATAQLTGELGVALVTAGPGFANALSPLFGARFSESPVMLLGGDAPIGAEGKGAFQELAQREIARSGVKASMRPERVREIGEMAAQLIAKALSPRPGPVHLALPFDLLKAPVDERDRSLDPGALAPSQLPMASSLAARLAQLVAQAERPLFVTGPWLSRSRNAALVEALERATSAPVIAMESPRGLRDPSLGAFPECLAQADLVVLLGKMPDFSLNFAQSPTLAKDARLAVIDPDPSMIERARRAVKERLVFSARAGALEAAQAIVQAASIAPVDGDAWHERVARTIAARCEIAESDSPPPLPPAAERSRQEEAPFERRGLHPRAVCAAVQRLLDAADDPILVCDGGEYGQWAQALCHAPTRIVNGPFGAIGGGICQALAAALERPRATIVAMMGDGSAGFHFMEFDTAARYGARFIAVIGNDFRWNAEHRIQLREYGADRLIGCELSAATRYDRLAAALGGYGERVRSIDALDAALESALASGRCACIDVEIESVAAPLFASTASPH
ncbi:MAG: thiamine pyrophosphate-binding protein [Ectothiorhodospiraceae bacterium AqS1]|nr:thiamine pyrophosphate-binding protein [Ectothiorhodospiraceae bacterium AqS1]